MSAADLAQAAAYVQIQAVSSNSDSRGNEQIQADKDRAFELNQKAISLYQSGKASEAEPLFAAALQLNLKTYGEKHPETLTSTDNYASVLDSVGRTKEAEILYSKSVVLHREVFGPKHPDTVTAINNHAYVLLAMGRAAEAVPLYSTALQLKQEIFGEKHPATLGGMNDYGLALQSAGRLIETEKVLGKALSLRKQVLGDEHPDTLTSLHNYAVSLQFLGRLESAEPLYARSLKLTRSQLGEKHADTIAGMIGYGFILYALGRLPEAEEINAKALPLSQSVFGLKHPSTLTNMTNYAAVLMALGRHAEAEPVFADVLRFRREVLGENHPDTLTGLNNYATILEALDRSKEAEPLFEEVLRSRTGLLGKTHPDTLVSVTNYATILKSLGRVEEAAALYAEALQLTKQTLGEKHPLTQLYLNNYAIALRLTGRTAEAASAYDQSLAIAREVLGDNHPQTLLGLGNYGVVLETLGRKKEAESLYLEALTLKRKVLGPQHPGTRHSEKSLATIRLRTPSRAHLALAPARALISGIRISREAAGFTPSDEAILARSENDQASHFNLFANAAWIRGDGFKAVASQIGRDVQPLTDKDLSGLKEEVFTALQDSLSNAAGKAVAQSAARRAAGTISAELGPLALRRQELSVEWAAIDRALVKVLGEQGETGMARRDNLRSLRNELEGEMSAIDDRLRDAAPDYFALIRPEALTLDEARKVLKSDEAALMVVPTSFGTHIMLVSDEGLLWTRSDWTRARIDAVVKRLLWDVGADIEVDLAESLEWEEQNADQGVYPYDVNTAHSLYRELIGPIKSGLVGKKHLFISASGSLSSLPFGILVTDLPKGKHGDPHVLRSTKWFSDSHALVQIPSLQALQFLRNFRSKTKRSLGTNFLGFGDPILTGQAATRGSRGIQKYSEGKNGGIASLFSSQKTRNGAGIADVSQVRKMSRLPGTAIELKGIWEAFGKPDDALFLDQAATEKNVKNMDLSGVDILAFATHGVLAGSIGGIAEPGLVLTPPQTGSEIDDGLLSASEVSALKLNTDWVILSACNTAAGDGSEGAPGLSGLARSFFYAGAQNLLASHWPVRDDVAAKITVRIVRILQANPRMSRAEAFQQTIREIRNDSSADSDTDTWAHPNAWAPFVLVGDGAS